MDLYKDTTHQKGGMKVSKVETMGWKNAILGMRYPLNSEAMSDTYVDESGRVVVGEKDKDLIVRLSVAGSAHRKVLRMIHIQMSVKMPMTWWKHEATHKVGVTEISRSTMHKGVGKETLTRTISTSRNGMRRTNTSSASSSSFRGFTRQRPTRRRKRRCGAG